MGAIQEPTPDMGPYVVEARGWSFYLHRVGTPGDGISWDGTYRGGELSLPRTDLPQLLAALAQAAPFAAMDMGPEPTPDPDTAALFARPWRVDADTNTVRISGPWTCSLEDHDGTPVAHAEITYDRLAELDGFLKMATVRDGRLHIGAHELICGGDDEIREGRIP